jgi:hypothetical protein
VHTPYFLVCHSDIFFCARTGSKTSRAARARMARTSWAGKFFRRASVGGGFSAAGCLRGTLGAERKPSRS